ncbi:MAG: aquaporin, partial [Candidatus Eremiobacteraeota bacterium]|nr:aquaporin [Candidatus Eremiobacteraeota bacterium]
MKSPLGQKLGAELFGTFFVTLAATSVDVLYYTGAHVDFVSRWLARGFVTIAMVWAFTEISGAHIDPAVSFGFLVRGVLPVGRMLAYWAAQFGGAFAAAALAYALWAHNVALGASHPGPGYSYFVAFIAEIVATFLLMLVILMTAEHEGTVGKNAALAVGFSVATCGFFLGPISGASMNPARSIAPQIFGGQFDLIW